MTRSFQAPERIGAREQELLANAQFQEAPGNTVQRQLTPSKGTTDHDGDGKMGGVKGRKPKAKRGKS